MTGLMDIISSIFSGMQGPSCRCSKRMDVDINCSNNCSRPSVKSTAEAGYHDFLVKHPLSHTWVHGQCGCRGREVVICFFTSSSQCRWSVSPRTHKNSWCIMCQITCPWHHVLLKSVTVEVVPNSGEQFSYERQLRAWWQTLHAQLSNESHF